MKCYVSGASAEADMVANWMAKLRAAGIEITLDWTASLKVNIAAGKTDAMLTEDERVAYAEADLGAIDRAELVWILAPTPGNSSMGLWVELGYALSMQAGLNIIVSGQGRKRCIFVALADHQFETHDEACEFILAAAEDPT